MQKFLLEMHFFRIFTPAPVNEANRVMMAIYLDE